MVTQREMNSAKRQLNTLVNDAIELLNESKSMEINEMNTGILLVCRESIEEELENYKKQLNDFINTLETENEENDKLLENYENTTMNGKITLNKLNRVIMGFQQQREKQLELEERIRKEKYEYEQERYEQELQLKKTEMELALREKLEIEKLQIEKMKLQNEKELKSTEIEVRTKENTQRADSQRPTNIATVKLPKLMLAKFDGNLLHWQEFWDSFETTIHNNTSLQDVDKLNYLRAQLRNEAKDVIAGLEITNASYAVAVDLLKERYNNKQLMIDAHYSQLRDIPTTTTYYEKLRSTFDQLERHLRSLEALGQDIENEFMVSLIRSKLPKLILAKLEEYKDANDIWTVQNLRKELKKYIATQELGDRLTKMNRSKLDFDRKHEDNGTYRQNQRYIHSSGNQSTGAFAVGETIRKTCVYCGKSHWSDECTEYPDLQSRKIKAKGHCFICLRKGHQLKECNSTRPCAYCKKKGNHHRSLCPNHFPTSQSELSSATLELKETNLVAAEERVIMQTALIELTDVKNVEDDVKQSARVLLDSGSQRTYISEDIANKLKLIPIDKNFLTIYTFGTTKPKCIETPVVEVKMVLKSGFTMKIKANVVPNVTGTIERRPINSKAMKETLKQYELADTLPVKAENCNIDLLIGNDYFADIVSMKRILLSDGLYLLGSKFGWILSGRTRNDNSIPKEYSLAMFTHSSSDISTNLLGFEKTDDCLFKQSRIEDFWALETIGIKDDSTITDDDKAISEFNKSIHLVNDRYQVRWPWREDNPTLPDNYKLSYGRLVSTMKRLKEDHETLKKYNDIIEDQIKKGIIEKIDNNTVQGEIKHYIPHHGVLKPSNRTTKLRVVYDASAKAKKTNLSLNECLYRGPVILEDLCSLLLRFRTHETAIVADIEKAFLQINLREEDRDVTRFLWLKDINKPVTPENIDVFRFARIPFGVISSPFILAATINYHLRSKEGPIAEKLAKDLYVDNLITGTSSNENGIQIYEHGKQIFKEMSMNLREWGSNSDTLRTSFAKEDRFDGAEMKVLGLIWNMYDDNVHIPIKESDELETYTKRHILKKTASVFDPLGFFNPVLLNAKLLLRELWKLGIDWDEPVKDQYANQWKEILKDINKIKDKKLQRFVGSKDAELLCFCDASSKAYGTSIYLRCKENGQTLTNLIFSKSRIAPLKETSLPRLELLAVLIGARSINFIEKSLQLNVQRKILWTDSQCVLHWLKSKKILTPFVQRRIEEIQSTEGIEFRYVSTDQNPADIASRGSTTKLLNESDIWWHGPNWLQNDHNSWPTWNTDVLSKHIMNSISGETKGPKVLYEVSTLAEEDLANNMQEDDQQQQKNRLPPFEMKSTEFSSMSRLLRVTAWANRFINNVRKIDKQTGYLNSNELKEAKKLWIYHVQYEMAQMITKTITTKDNNIINSLGLQLDESGMIKCNGRFTNSPNMPEKTKKPIYLPKKNHWTTLLIKEYHEKLFHSGTSHTLSQLRNIYWIPQGRSAVKSVIFQCGACRKYHGGPYKMPKLADWPKEKITKAAPFTYTGLDYIGPFHIKENKETSKIWICIFTCVTIRAVHLEIVDDMTAEQFLMALRRFISRRNTPDTIILDNAPQFKLTKTAVDKAWQSSITHEDVQNFTTNAGIRWKFIVEFSPWMGEFYERLVGMVKSSLRKAIQRKFLTMTQFRTYAIECEKILNSRPLVYIDDDIESAEAITPNHFLCLNPKNATPILEDDRDPDFKPQSESTDELLEIWRKGQSHLNEFWKYWYNDYVLSLRERYQTHLRQPRIKSRLEPKIGQIVHIKEDLPRSKWRMAKIIKLIESTDNEIRAANVLLPNGKTINRPINLLYPLETAPVIESKVKDDENEIQVDDRSDVPKRKRKSPRNAAITARFRLKELFNDEIGTFVWCRECHES